MSQPVRGQGAIHRAGDSGAQDPGGTILRGAGAIARGLTPAREARPLTADDIIHVVGIAGAGASAAGLLASAAGATVDGCDPGAPSAYTAALTARGLSIRESHDPAHVAALDARRLRRLAVTKALTSVQPDHPELERARLAGIPIEAWQQVVADAALTQGGRLVAVAGTHGKSTSAGWLVHLLAGCGRDPAAFVGALLPADLTEGIPATARWGRGDTFIVEADEYAGNFDPFRPSIALVLNAEWDHPDVFRDTSAVVDTFEAWLRSPGWQERRAVIGVGDAGGAKLAGRLADWGDRLVVVEAAPAASPGPARTKHEDRAGRPVSWSLQGDELRIDDLPGSAPFSLRTTLRIPGRHNAANGACVAALGALLGVDAGELASGLASFGGVGRRFEIKGEPAGVLVVDDYGHHPTAIRATIAATRERYPGRAVWVAHEPLTFHRAAAMLDELADALATADHVVVADIWAGRDPDTSITSAAQLAKAVTERSGRHAAAPGSVEATADHLAAHVRPGDIVLALGGGRSYVIADRLVSLLAGRSAG